MFIINKETNRIEKLESSTFKLLGFKECENLQEWIANESELIWLKQDEAVKLEGIEKYNKTIHR